MKARLAALLLFLAVCCVLGRAQTVTPSVTIGTHVLTLGMSESTVLEQIGTDLILRRLPAGAKPASAATPATSAWAVQRKTASGFDHLGSLFFDGSHHLAGAMRNWEVEETSSKSLFYALDSVTKSLKRDGLNTCQVRTTDNDYSVEDGSLHEKGIVFDCGQKQISVVLTLSDSPSTASGMEVVEWLHNL